MFKIIRDGQEVKDPRTINIAIAKDTLEICKQGSYNNRNNKLIRLGDSIQRAIDGTHVIEHDAMLPAAAPAVCIMSMPEISVTNEKAVTAARRMIKEGKNNIAVLNFASGICPGGGFLGGSSAQEEDLCRASGLYPCLKNKPMFYNVNIGGDSHYNDNIIFSPNVPFFKDDVNFDPLDQPIKLNVITSPAPNLRSPTTDGHATDSNLPEILKKRAIRIFEVAKSKMINHLILGAWGCGAFRNDPQMVSDAFKEAMLAVPGFESICFAVYDTGDCVNFKHFTSAFK